MKILKTLLKILEDSYVYGNVKVRGHCHIVISQENIEALRIEIEISTLH